MASPRVLGRRLRCNKDTFVDPSEREPEAPVVVGEPVVFAQPAPDAVVEEAPRRPAKKRKRETVGMPPEYVKEPGKPGQLHPHWRKSFPDDEADADGRGDEVDGVDFVDV